LWATKSEAAIRVLLVLRICDFARTESVDFTRIGFSCVRCSKPKLQFANQPKQLPKAFINQNSMMS